VCSVLFAVNFEKSQGDLIMKRVLYVTVKFLLNSAVLLILFSFFSPHTGDAQYLIVNPESIVYDSLNNRYLVTCWGNGRIVEIDSTGNQSLFETGFYNLLGNHIDGNALYVSSNAGVQGFDLSTGSEVLHVAISGVGQIDGLTSDDSGHLYVVDGIRRRIYKVNIANQTYTTFVNSGLPAFPQDCIFDREHNRLLVVAWAAAAGIQAVSLEDSSVSTVVTTSFGYFDGITKDQYGNVYVASHSGNGEIYVYDNDFSNHPELVSSGHNEPAGLGFNNRDNIIAVPNFAASTIDYIPYTPTSIEDKLNILPRNFTLSQNFPNPFNPSTTIRFSIEEKGSGSLSIFDVRGRIVKTFPVRGSGSHAFVWDGRDDTNQPVGSGIYFYRLKTATDSHIRKMVMME
jgi:sugar lactone lactonase YvrE